MSGGLTKRRPKAHHAEELNVVPLIDIMANLLFFLMVGMDMKEKQEAGENVELPTSTSKAQDELGRIIQLQINKDELLYEGVKQATLRAGKFDPAELNKDGFLTKLKAELEKRRKTFETDGSDPTQDKNKPVVFLVADRKLEYDTVEKVMRSSGSAGFPRFRFAVMNR